MSLTRKQFIKTSLAFAAIGVLPACSDDETGAGTPGSGSSSSSAGNGGNGAAGSGGSGAQGGGGSGTGAQGGGGSGAQGGGGAGQGGNGGTGGNPTAQCENGVDSDFDKHPHTLIVSAADVAAGADKDYVATEGGHTHPVTITAANFAALAAGQTVTVDAGPGGGHTHIVTLVCA